MALVSVGLLLIARGVALRQLLRQQSGNLYDRARSYRQSLITNFPHARDARTPQTCVVTDVQCLMRAPAVALYREDAAVGDTPVTFKRSYACGRRTVTRVRRI